MKGSTIGLLIVVAILFAFVANRQWKINHPVVMTVQAMPVSANQLPIKIQVPISAPGQSNNLFTYQPTSGAPISLTWTVNIPGKSDAERNATIPVPTSEPRSISWTLGSTSGTTTILPYTVHVDSRMSAKASGYASSIPSRPMWRGIWSKK